jgi:hypothetical protein
MLTHNKDDNRCKSDAHGPLKSNFIKTTEPNGKKFTGILLWWTSSTLMNLVSIQNNTIWLPDPIMQFDWLSHKSSIVKKQLWLLLCIGEQF